MRYFAWLLIKSIWSSEQYHTQIEPYTYYKSLYVKKRSKRNTYQKKARASWLKGIPWITIDKMQVFKNKCSIGQLVRSWNASAIGIRERGKKSTKRQTAFFWSKCNLNSENVCEIVPFLMMMMMMDEKQWVAEGRTRSHSQASSILWLVFVFRMSRNICCFVFCCCRWFYVRTQLLVSPLISLSASDFKRCSRVRLPYLGVCVLKKNE